jgi:hypothetical protein
VARLKAKSCLGDVAKELRIPAWEIRDVQDAVIERSTGDARAQFCVIGRARVARDRQGAGREVPRILIAGKLEGPRPTHRQARGGRDGDQHAGDQLL